MGASSYPPHDHQEVYLKDILYIPHLGATVDNRYPARLDTYYTTIVPRGFVYEVMQDLYHRQYTRT